MVIARRAGRILRWPTYDFARSQDTEESKYSGRLTVWPTDQQAIDHMNSEGFAFALAAGAGAYALTGTNATLTYTQLWTPLALGAALRAWYPLNQISGSDGDPQGTIVDSSGNGFNSTPQTGGQRATLAAADLNGKNTLRFAKASSQFYDLPDIFSGASAGSMYFVAKSFADPADHGTPGNFGSGTAGHWGYVDGEVYDNFGSTTRPDCGNPTPSLSSTYRIASIWSAANDRGILIDGAAFFASATNTVGFTATPWLGRGGAYFDGWIAEMVLTNAKQSTTDRQKAEGYLAHKWGLTGSLAGDHPYKTTPP